MYAYLLYTYSEGNPVILITSVFQEKQPIIERLFKALNSHFGECI